MKIPFTPNRDSLILQKVTGKKVLHIGACDSPYTEKKLEKDQLLYQKIDKVCKEQIGVDIDKESILILEEKNFEKSKIIYHDLNEQLDFYYSPDIVIFGETIEHLTNIGLALKSLKQFMGEHTELLITTPNAYSVNNFIGAVFGKEHQHPDHSLLFSLQTLSSMCEKNKLKVIKKGFTSLESDAENLNIKGRMNLFVQKIISPLFPRLSPTLFFVVKKND